jgi:hypothetical protein
MSHPKSNQRKLNQMAQFTDKEGQVWNVNLDPVLADEIKQAHGIEIVNLEKDPMLTLRTDPMKLVAVIHILCQDQIQSMSLSPQQFAKRLPFPPDQMLSAIEAAIVGFFPTGRHSHVQEVLTSYASMGSKTDELITAKMASVIMNPATAQMMSNMADAEIAKAMKTLTDSQAGT